MKLALDVLGFDDEIPVRGLNQSMWVSLADCYSKKNIIIIAYIIIIDYLH